MARIVGRMPELSTTGGTSDARFIKDVCPVCEFGMVGATAHKVDENVAVADIETLTRIYGEVLGRLLPARLAMLTTREVILSLYGAWRLAHARRRRPRLLRPVDRRRPPLVLRDGDGGTALCADGRRRSARTAGAAPLRFALVEVIAYVMSWVAYPVVVEALTRLMGCREHFESYLAPTTGRWCCRTPSSCRWRS